ncbi:hypothetical protein [Mycobacterium neumannii]|uniref:hypothetical protein n=1 Tax=Mycobacterium neumannii TaxID=2048551 RepID=UPI003AB3B302
MFAAVADSVTDRLAEESKDSVVVFLVDRVSEASGSGLVVDRPEPTVVLGFVPETVAVEEASVDFASASPVDDDVPDELAEVSVDPVDALADPDEELPAPDELDAPAEELADDCPPSSATAVPIPQVPTNPATPSEKATAPTRNATLAEFTSGPTPPSDR